MYKDKLKDLYYIIMKLDNDIKDLKKCPLHQIKDVNT